MISLGLFVAGAWLAERLPATLLYAAARAIGAVLGSLPLPAQRRLRRNLAMVTGQPTTSRTVRRAVRAATQVHAANYVDLLRSSVVSGDAATRGLRPAGEGWDALRQAAAARRGAVLVSAHFGRFERLSHYLGHLGFTITLPVERLDPPALFDLVRRLRQRPTFTLVPHDAALRPALRALAAGEIVAFFADWDPSGQGTEVEFFGWPARLPGGPAYIARRAGVPIFVGFSVPDAQPDSYCVALDPPFDVPRTDDLDADVRQATQAVARAFERRIAARPEQWVLFHDLWPCARLGRRPRRARARGRVAQQ